MTTTEENKGCFKMKIIEYHDIKTLLGPCFVSFSLPLLVPGVVLTVVGTYGNENTFPLFGAWHITGIVILSIAVLMLFSGIILKCCYRPIISADIEEHLSPTSSMITGSKNLGYDDDIYSSKRAQNSNKVGHHDMNNSHTVVSTHEAKQTSNTGQDTQFLANSAIAENQSRRKKQQTAQVSTDTKQSSGVKSTSNSNKTQPPPSYDRIQAETKQKVTKDNTTGVSVVETTQGNVTTKVTATITAEAEMVRASSSRDQSSDANENSKFLPEKKRKKKKKRKRQESSQSLDTVGVNIGESSSSVHDGELSSKRELPELRMRPVLIHDGVHHHHDLHVHFQNGSEATNKLKENINETPNS